MMILQENQNLREQNLNIVQQSLLHQKERDKAIKIQEMIEKKNAELVKENKRLSKIQQIEQQKEILKECENQKKMNDFDKYIENVKNQYPDIQDIAITDEVKNNLNLEELIHITFTSGDQKVKCIVICKKNEIFNSVVNKVYETRPEFRENNNYFYLGNGINILQYKSLEENNLKDGMGVIVNLIDN